MYGDERLQINCPICYSHQILYGFSQHSYCVFRCAACGFQFVHPTPTPAELARYYDQSYAVPLARYAGNRAQYRPYCRSGALAARPLSAPLEAAGWVDELLCYARRP